VSGGSWLKNNLWRHALAWTLIVFTLFPIYVVVATSFDPSGSIAANLVPNVFSWKNYTRLFTDPNVPYTIWLKNSLIVASVNAIFSVLIGAAAAFAFSRLRFKGRKIGLQTLLLVQVFPSFLAATAIYVMMERVFQVFPAFGLGSSFSRACFCRMSRIERLQLVCNSSSPHSGKPTGAHSQPGQ
jgi:arabinogalactan oligomer / maltooligosaccharide transport system permease protein